eukprot:4007084-Amphidinium_carterae.1
MLAKLPVLALCMSTVQTSNLPGPFKHIHHESTPFSMHNFYKGAATKYHAKATTKIELPLGKGPLVQDHQQEGTSARIVFQSISSLAS